LETFVGSGAVGRRDATGLEASFAAPAAIALDGSGNAFVTEHGNNSVRKIERSGRVTTVVQGLPSLPGVEPGNAKDVRFGFPTGIAVLRNGSLAVADTQNNRVLRVTENGTVLPFAGTGRPGFSDGGPATAEFKNPLTSSSTGKGNCWWPIWGTVESGFWN
jgi:hypothetical protein